MTTTGPATRPAEGGEPTNGARQAAQSAVTRALELVRGRAASAEAEAYAQVGSSSLTRFANSTINQNVAEETSHLGLRVSLDGRVAGARLDGPIDDESLTRLVDGVLEGARLRPTDPDWPGLAPIAPAPDIDHWDDATAAAPAADRARRVADFVSAADGLETAGFCSTYKEVVAFANSAGQSLVGRSTLATLDGIARTATSDGSGRASSVSVEDLDGLAIGEVATRKARDSQNPKDLDPGHYEVILEPRSVADVLQFLFVHGLNGLAVSEGRSFVRVGDTQLDSSVTIVDDVTDPATTGVPFDVEGTPRRRLDLIAGGRTRALLHTRRTAKQMGGGAQSTAAALEDAVSWGALPANPGLLAGDRSIEELIGAVERGVLVTDFWYTRVLDPRTLVVTGLTRNGVWLIEDGRIAHPITNLRFTQSYADALGPGLVRGIGSDRALTPAGFGGIYLVPAVHLGSWNFTGGARG
jgi:predicted Zn-dependent protease